VSIAKEPNFSVCIFLVDSLIYCKSKVIYSSWCNNNCEIKGFTIVNPSHEKLSFRTCGFKEFNNRYNICLLLPSLTFKTPQTFHPHVLECGNLINIPGLEVVQEIQLDIEMDFNSIISSLSYRGKLIKDPD
jgi:hypothetical protein